MLYDKLREVYLDYVNNSLTATVFAEHHGLTYYQAVALIDLGRECHESYVKRMQSWGMRKGMKG